MEAQTIRLRYSGRVLTAQLTLVSHSEDVGGAEGAVARAQFDCKAGSYWVGGEGF